MYRGKVHRFKKYSIKKNNIFDAFPKAEIVSSKQVHACPSCINSHMTPQTNLLQILSLKTIDNQLGFGLRNRGIVLWLILSLIYLRKIFFSLETSIQSNGNSYLVEDGLLALMHWWWDLRCTKCLFRRGGQTRADDNRRSSTRSPHLSLSLHHHLKDHHQQFLEVETFWKSFAEFARGEDRRWGQD